MKKILTVFAIAGFSALFSQITINGNFPSSMGSGSSIDTDVKINKGAVGNFAKYQMDVTAGIVVSIIDPKGGNFTFENNRAKIVWVSVPSDPEFTVKLKIQASSDAANPATLTQKFYYLENNEKKEIEAAPVIISLGGGSGVASTPVETKPAETKPVEPVATSTPVETKPTETKPIEPIATSTPVETKPTETKPTETAATKKTTTPSTSEAGMTFKVQIGAYTTQPSKNKFSGAGNVSIDLINGMYKVTTGNFKTLDDAVKHRDELKAKGFSGFIAKFKNGVRIN